MSPLDEEPVPVVLPTVTFAGYQHMTQQPVRAGGVVTVLNPASPYPATFAGEVQFADTMKPVPETRLPEHLKLDGRIQFANPTTFSSPA